MNDMNIRQDGLTVGSPFFVIQIFDHEGYFSSCLAASEEDVRRKVSFWKNQSFVMFSVPFEGLWNGQMPIVTAPWGPVPPEAGLVPPEAGSAPGRGRGSGSGGRRTPTPNRASAPAPTRPWAPSRGAPRRRRGGARAA